MGGPGSGRRPGLFRAPDLSRADLASPPSATPFSGASFVGWIGSVTPTRTGVRINMTVKYEDREDVKVLWDAIGVPLQIDMSEWDEYREARELLEGGNG